MLEKLRIRISQIFACLLFVLICVSSSLWEDKAPFATTVMFFLGAVLAGLASLGRLWCSVYIAGYKKERLVTLGPYVGALGVGLASETLLIPLVILIAFVGYYSLVIKAEEAELMRLHKNEFEIYMKEVPRFFPKISLLKESEEYIMNPKVFKRHMFNAFWFIWFVGILEVIEELHEFKVLPTIFKIY
jgi:protein-S-isoprenylcysteine O-methyltransferase Ste14